VLSDYYQRNFDISTAKDFCETSISLALSTQNTKMQSHALCTLAWINWFYGDYSKAQMHVKEAHRLVALCGMSDGLMDHRLMNTQAEIHKVKSEYVAARSIHSRILQETSVDQDSYTYGIALLNVAEIDVAICAPKEDVQSVYEKAREIFNTHNCVTEVVICDMIFADLHLREANFLTAKTLFKRCLKLSERNSEIMTYCLERLGDASRWGANVSNWTTVFLVHSVQRQEKLGIHKALQFLGDTFLAQNEEHIAINLFTVALEGFTYMDVHCSRAECILQLGDISKGHGDLLKAVELWTTQGHCLNSPHRPNNLKILIKGWLVLVKMCWSNTGTI
jgi:hypothetical protein